MSYLQKLLMLLNSAATLAIKINMLTSARCKLNLTPEILAVK